MKVCFFLNGFCTNGGIGRVTSVLANCLAEKEEMQVVTLSYFRENLPQLFSLSPKIQQEFFLEHPQSMAKTMLQGGEFKLRAFLKKNKIDVLVACGSLYFPVSVRACKWTNTKCVCWEHTNPNVASDYKFQKAARKYGACHSDCNVVLTKSAVQAYSEMFHTKNTVQIYNPLDARILECASDYNTTSKRIVSVGRLSYPKYFEMAIEIAAEVLPGRPEWSWDIFGEGEARTKLAALIHEKGLDDRMKLCGQVNDIYNRYKNYAVMVMTSRYEGFPMTLLEGLGNGLPLVSFDIATGPNEIIRNEENGYLIPPFDKKQMVVRLERLMDDASLREKMSAEARKDCAAFSQDAIVKQWEALLRQLAEGK